MATNCKNCNYPIYLSRANQWTHYATDELQCPRSVADPGPKPTRDEIFAQFSHPVQPLALDENGVLRFKRNHIIDFLFNSGKLNLN